MSVNPHHPPRKSTRLQGYDYAQNGAYFITLCTQNRVCLFGNVEGGEVHLNDAGHMIMHWYAELKNKFPNIELDICVLMPNHLHAIVVLLDDATTTRGVHAGTPLQNRGLDHIIQWLKTMTTNAYMRAVKDQNWQPFPGKLWQRSYYDHIIRNEADLNTHRQYILSNPARWDLDDDNPAVNS